nr:MAG TPA: hypothetical protein [Caudoviricetes sp.]
MVDNVKIFFFHFINYSILDRYESTCKCLTI